MVKLTWFPGETSLELPALETFWWLNIGLVVALETFDALEFTSRFLVCLFCGCGGGAVGALGLWNSGTYGVFVWGVDWLGRGCVLWTFSFCWGGVKQVVLCKSKILYQLLEWIYLLKRKSCSRLPDEILSVNEVIKFWQVFLIWSKELVYPSKSLFGVVWLPGVVCGCPILIW